MKRGPAHPAGSTGRGAPNRHARATVALCCAAALLQGCGGDRGASLRADLARGEYSRAAARIEEKMTTDRASRDYMLDRMRLLFLRLADGRTARVEPVASGVFDLLRTQGINDDKTVAAAVLGEGGVIFWKGEPFEQAMAFAAVSIHKGIAGEWDNARAAALSSLFLLKDFGENERGGRKSTEDVARAAARSEAKRESGDGSAKTFEDYLDKGYSPTKSDFALGSLLAGVANLAMAREGGDPARDDEARDHFREAFTLRPDLKPVADALVSGEANTLFIVDFGAGPEKIAYGEDGALARFAPSTRSDARPLRLRLRNTDAGAFPIAGDVNRMAEDHMWNNFEDVRSAKSAIGTALLLGGGITAVSSDNSTAQIIGASLAGLGLLFKATARADTRHCEALPQRTYVAAVRIDAPDTAVRLFVDGAGAMGLTLPAIDPPSSPRGVGMHYVRLPHSSAQRPWQWPGDVVYANDAYAADVPGDTLPYILGGRCVRTPTLDVLRDYQVSGYLLDLSLAELESLYRDEGILFETRGVSGRDAMHILEGGRSMEMPAPGSAGYARVYCQPHAPYRPVSKRVADLAARIREEQGLPTPGGTTPGESPRVIDNRTARGPAGEQAAPRAIAGASR